MHFQPKKTGGNKITHTINNITLNKTKYYSSTKIRAQQLGELVYHRAPRQMLDSVLFYRGQSQVLLLMVRASSGPGQQGLVHLVIRASPACQGEAACPSTPGPATKPGFTTQSKKNN